MGRIIVCNNELGDSLKERYKAESKRMTELQTQMQRGLEKAKIKKEQEKQAMEKKAKIDRQRFDIEHERMVKMLTDYGYCRTITN